jgi:hypothetical protein
LAGQSSLYRKEQCTHEKSSQFPVRWFQQRSLHIFHEGECFHDLFHTHMPRRGFGLRSLVAAVAVVCSLAAGQQARAADIYVLTNNTGNNGSGVNFGRINTTSGAYTTISYISQALTGLTWRNTNQQFYVTDNTGGAFGAPLRTLTTSGTLSSSLGNTIGAYGLA